MKMSGKPDAGNLHVRFDEGDQTHTLVPTLPSRLRHQRLLGVTSTGGLHAFRYR
jgi:hypothetical protein